MTRETHVQLREGEAWSEWSLTPEQAWELDRSELVDVRAAGRVGMSRLRARDQVGAVRLGRGTGRVRLSIDPKVPVDRLMYLLGYAPDRLVWDKQQVDAVARTDLLPAVAHAFNRATRRALRSGPLRGYQETDDTLPVLRGRLRASDQLSRHPGLTVPLEVTYDEHTVDVPENRLLLGAVRRLLRVPGLEPRLRAELQGFAAQLDGVTPQMPGAPLPVWQPNRLNKRYQPVLALAALILGGASYELEDGRTIAVDGLVFRMWQVYEDFLGRALGEALVSTVGGRAEPADRNHYLTAGRRHLLMPDLLHYLPGESGVSKPAIVVDAKYKRAFHRDDLYQMLAYCVRLGLDDGHLVYAGGKPNVVRVPVRGGEIRLHRHVLDLRLPHQELRNRIDRLAATLAESLPTSSRAAKLASPTV
ncbi:McrC family protein [Streptomyces atroolivaceus]|uniref:McrC family protein n=1 Tax=Streptomyces atroolivaceus TaxID=66869 RepID=UPI0034441B1B